MKNNRRRKLIAKAHKLIDEIEGELKFIVDSVKNKLTKSHD